MAPTPPRSPSPQPPSPPSAPSDGAFEPAPARGLRDYLGLYLRGVAMGAADIVPGVSGGTMALILGIYRELIGALRAAARPPFVRALLRREWRRAAATIHGPFLLALGAGIVTAIATLARGLEWLLEHHTSLVFAFFFGLVLASVLAVGRRVGRWSASAVLALVAAAAFAYVLVGLTPAVTPETPLFLALCGAVAICAMILPGISGSFILVLLGKYEYVLDAVTRGDVGVLAFVFAGAAAGLLSFAQLLGWLFRRYERTTLAALTGFMLGSLRRVWPWQEALDGRLANLAPPSAEAALLAAALAAAGAVAVLGLEHLGATRSQA